MYGLQSSPTLSFIELTPSQHAAVLSSHHRKLFFSRCTLQCWYDGFIVVKHPIFKLIAWNSCYCFICFKRDKEHAMKRVLSYTHNTTQPRQQGNCPTDTLNNNKNHDYREMEELKWSWLPLQSAAVQYSAWWTLPCSETRRQKNSATRKWSERSRRQEGKWAKFWLTQVVSLRFSIFCNKEKHQHAVRSDKVLNNKPRTLRDTIKLSALDPENIYFTLRSLKYTSKKTKTNFNQKEEVNYKHT